MPTQYSDMKNRVCLITGATSGIGLVTAMTLANQGAVMVTVGRNPQKGEATVASIRQKTGNSAVELMQADLSVQAEVRHLAQEFKNRYSRLDVLINNAGAVFLRRQLSPDGIEMTFAVNHLSHFLLTNLLLDTLKAGAPARIINVSSDAHRKAQMRFDDLEGRRKYSGMGAYGQSKLAILLFTYELARRLEGTQVMVNAVHPGLVATNLGKNNGWAARLIVSLLKFVAISPEKGAQPIIYLASSPEVASVTGKYYEGQHMVPSSPVSYGERAAARLWEISAKMTGLL